MLGPVDIDSRVRELGGAARLRDLGGSRATRRQVARLIAEGQLVAHAGGCVALPGADPDIVRAWQFGARLTCVSAARAHGFALLDEPTVTHLAIPHSRGPATSSRLDGTRVLVHREVRGLLTAGPHPRVPGGCGPPVVGPAEALARVLRCQEPLAAVVAIDSALQARACTVREIGSLLAGPGSPAARAVLGECDGRSLSPAESVARVTLTRAGLNVEPNLGIAGVGVVDLLVEGRVVVECDGFAYHADRRSFTADRRRDRALQLLGFVVLRFPAAEILRAPADLLAAVRAAVALA